MIVDSVSHSPKVWNFVDDQLTHPLRQKECRHSNMMHAQRWRQHGSSFFGLWRWTHGGLVCWQLDCFDCFGGLLWCPLHQCWVVTANPIFSSPAEPAQMIFET